MDYGLIAELTTATGRLSLLIFCAAFVLDASGAPYARKKLWYWVFVATHILHLGFIGPYYWAGGDFNNPIILSFLIVGVGVVFFLAFRLATGGPGDRAAPALAAWYLWVIFSGSQIVMLNFSGRGGAVNWALLALTIMAGGLRLRMALADRRGK